MAINVSSYCISNIMMLLLAAGSPNASTGPSYLAVGISGVYVEMKKKI
jgi:hypothetical protein